MSVKLSSARIMSMLSALALIAMVVRGLVPAGYMIAAAAPSGHFINVVICHGDGGGTSTVLLDASTGKFVDVDNPADSKGSDLDSKSSCPFAVTAHFALPTIMAAVPQAYPAHFTYQAPLPVLMPGRGLIAPPPPARAPPVFS